MLSIRDAIKRVGRSVKTLETFTNEKSSRKVAKKRKREGRQHIIEPDDNLTRQELQEYKPLVARYQRKIFQNFLEPLNQVNLKTFDENLPDYDEHRASQYWKKRNSGSSTQVLNNFLENRRSFNRMMKLLLELTPDRLRTKEAHNPRILQSILNEQESQRVRNIFPDTTPKNSFHEVPSIPSDLTVESFQKYIYSLTHSKYYYRNSSSLKSGIIADILLYTHKITNENIKPYRSVHTYNYLIKYFGYDKNQSSFAREMLLVMNKDGHRPNIDTINNLLRLCQIQSNIRSISNTFDIIYKYLRLSKSFDIELNLTTYNRIYDSIKNIFLKEEFLNEIHRTNLIISPHLLLRIIDDYMKTTKDTNDVIDFVENELKYPNWREDSKICNKIIFHKAIYTDESQESINGLLSFSQQGNVDEYTFKYLVEAISKNESISKQNSPINEFHVLWFIYCKLSHTIGINSNVPHIYKYMTDAVIASRFPTDCQSFFLRGLIYDATNAFSLPEENRCYLTSEVTVSSQAENYKIFKRIVGLDINAIEARISHSNLSCDPPLQRLDAPYSSLEKDRWNDLKRLSRTTNQNFAYDDVCAVLLQTGLKFEPDIKVPAQVVDNYTRAQQKSMANSRMRDQLSRLKRGNDKHVEHLLIDRGVLPSTYKGIA